MKRLCVVLCLCLALLGFSYATHHRGAAGVPLRGEAAIFTPRQPVYFTRFTESDRCFVNPGMGAVAWASDPERVVDGSLVLVSYTWRQLEPSRGTYAWQEAERENHLAEWTRRGNQLMLILAMDVPKLADQIGFELLEIPRWLYEELKAEAKQGFEISARSAATAGERERAKRALWEIEHDAARIDEFNRSHQLPANSSGAQTLDIPGVGTFYRYRIGTGGGEETRCGFSPNYSSPLLLRYHGILLSELARRYDNPQTYAIVMGSVGHWGEMHTYFIEPGSAGRYPPRSIASQYEEDYARYFKSVWVSVRYPREVAVRNGYGLHCHAFGDERSVYEWHIDFYQKGYTDYVSGESYPAMKDFWKHAPSGGEFLYTGDARYLEDARIESTLRQARDTHLTWFNELSYGLNEETARNQERLFATIGYRLTPKWVSYSLDRGSREISVDSVWRNAGTAPFYAEWPLRVMLRDETGNPVASADFERLMREWMPGESGHNRATLRLPDRLPPGRYRLFIGLFDPSRENIAVRFAIEEEPVDGWYRVGGIVWR